MAKLFGILMQSWLTIVVVSIASQALEQPVFSEEKDGSEVRAAIARSIPFIEREGNDWIETRDCLSCHHTSFMVWSLNAASKHGFQVDSAKLAEWNAWATDWHNLVNAKNREQAVQADTLRSHSDTLAQLVLGKATQKGCENPPSWIAEYTAALAKGQQEDGSWLPGGQLPGQKRPKRETQEVSTMWSLIALTDSGLPADALSTSRDRARKWLGEESIGLSTEWWATRLMLERNSGDEAKAHQFRTELLNRQRADGGWGWLCAEESDALGTGIALFALSRNGTPPNHSAIEHARGYLTHSQADDGSWPVRGTKESARNRVERTATFWGTCWAVIGLCETLDQKSTP